MRDLLEDPFLRAAPVHSGFKVLPPVVLYERIGEGAMGNVYQGWHYNLDIEVAVKCLKPELIAQNAEYGTRFQREAKVAAQIAQENLVRVYDTLEGYGQCYTVMEFVDGENLENRIARRGRSTVGEALAMTVAVARALAALHKKRIIHRDVKPANILITRDGHVKLADLGIAKDERGGDSLKTNHDAVIGTPQYMSPEQFEHSAGVTDRTDTYAAGATLAFMLVGNHVITGDSLNQLMRRVIVDGFPDVGEMCPDLLPEVVALIRQCTSRDPAKRPDAEMLSRQATVLLHQCDPNVSLADERAATSYGSNTLPSRLDRTRLREIRAAVTHHTPADAFPPTLTGPGGMPPTMVPTAAGGYQPARVSMAYDAPPATSSAAPGPPKKSMVAKLVVAVLLLGMLAVMAAAGAGYSYWTRKPTFIWGPTPTPTPTPQPTPTPTPTPTPVPTPTPQPLKPQPTPQPTPTPPKPDPTPLPRPWMPPTVPEPEKKVVPPRPIPQPRPTPDPKLAMTQALNDLSTRLAATSMTRQWGNAFDVMTAMTQAELGNPANEARRVTTECNLALTRFRVQYADPAERDRVFPDLADRLRRVARYGSSVAAMLVVEALVPWEDNQFNIARLKDASAAQVAVFTEAAEWAKMAADSDLAPQDEACVFLGEIYLKYARLAAGHQDIAFKYLQQGADHQNINSMARLGAGQYIWLSQQAKNERRPLTDMKYAAKVTEARQLMQRAADGGSAFSAYNIGKIIYGDATQMTPGAAKDRMQQLAERYLAQSARGKFPPGVEFCRQNSIAF